MIKLQILLIIQIFGWFSLSHGFASVTISTSIGLLGGTAVYYMLTQTNRGTLGQILASKRCPILENGTDDKLLYIDTYNWDGETRTTMAGIMYFYSLLVSEFTDKAPDQNAEAPLLPWGSFNIENDPINEVEKIRDYLVSISGGFVRFNITDVDPWNIYPLGIARLITENRDKTINTVEESISNTINRASDAIDNSKKSKKKRKQDEGEKKQSTIEGGLSDMTSVTHRRAISSRSPVHANKSSHKVHYEATPWTPKNDTSWGELTSIYEYLEEIMRNKYVVSKENVTFKNRKIERLALALILYWRERQFDISSVDPVNYDASKFRKSLGVFERSYATITDVASLGHGKRNGIRIAPWKMIPDSMWKHNPFQSFERIVYSVYSDEVKRSKYNSLNWNVYDYSIGVVLNTFSRDLVIHTVFGQYQEKVSSITKLYSLNPLKVKKYSQEGGSYIENKKNSKKESKPHESVDVPEEKEDSNIEGSSEAAIKSGDGLETDEKGVQANPETDVTQTLKKEHEEDKGMKKGRGKRGRSGNKTNNDSEGIQKKKRKKLN
ncbi:signal peptide-containing secreted protein [Cryptosporidium canis]|nr:signal peptide-containing secreted protein [Cryptosporidium canis]